MRQLNVEGCAIVVVVCSLVIQGCSNRVETIQTGSAGAEHGTRYQLQAEPKDAIGVLQLKESALDGSPIALIGRVGGGQKPWIEGRAAFLLVDDGVAPASRDEECGEDCAHCAAALAEATTVVKFVDEQGKVIATDARTLLGIEDFQTVVVQGIARKDKSGNVSVVADGIYIRR
jgi:hypothetical protein